MFLLPSNEIFLSTYTAGNLTIEIRNVVFTVAPNGQTEDTADVS